MKFLPRPTALLLAVLLVSAGLFVKQKVSLEAENLPGTVAGRKTNLLSSYPEIPVYNNATLVSVLEKEGSVVATLESPDDPQKIAGLYEDVLTANGWLGGPVNFAKNNKNLSVAAAQNAEKTQTVVVLNYSFVPTK